MNDYGPTESSAGADAEPSSSFLPKAVTDTIQLATIPEGSPSLSTDRNPFLSNTPNTTYPTQHRRRGSSQQNNLLRSVTRSWKPLAFISIPLTLVLLYAVIHPLIPGAPSLPSLAINADLRPADQQCLCGVTDEGKRTCRVYGEEGLKRSRMFDGSGARVRRMLGRAKMGLPMKVGILGGSVSACHGTHPNIAFPQGDPAGPGCYPTLLQGYLQDTFPLGKGQKHEIFNGAIGAMDSSYYAFCGTHHIPSDVDLIILEFDVNDQPSFDFQVFFDQLLRVMLELPSQPAVLILGTWSPKIGQEQGYGDPSLAHLPISHYYDVPYITMKRLVFNHYLRFPHDTARSFWQGDDIHPNIRGHRILGDLVISYLENQLCQLSLLGPATVIPEQETIKTTEPFSSLVDISFPFGTPKTFDPANPPPEWESTFDKSKIAKVGQEQRLFVSPPTPYSVPFTPLFQPLRDIVDPAAHPDPPNANHLLGLVQPKAFCADANNEKDPMKPTESEGWRKYDWMGEKHYWVSDDPGSRIKVDIKVNQGRIAVFYFRSGDYDLGDVQCWVDDNERGAVRLPGWWEKSYNVASVAYIDEKVTPGDHYVTCEVMKETSHPTNPNAHHFRITAIMAT